MVMLWRWLVEWKEKGHVRFNGGRMVMLCRWTV